MDLGPADVLCDINVGTYLTNSPTPGELDCLTNFFRQVRNGPIVVDSMPIANQHLVYTCGHILQLDVQPGQVTVTDMYRGCLPP